LNFEPPKTLNFEPAKQSAALERLKRLEPLERDFGIPAYFLILFNIVHY